MSWVKDGIGKVGGLGGCGRGIGVDGVEDLGRGDERVGKWTAFFDELFLCGG